MQCIVPTLFREPRHVVRQVCRKELLVAQGDVVQAAQELQMKGMMLVSGALTVSLIGLGDELGLYKALKAGGGPMTPAELAKATGTHERWVREWLYQQVCHHATNCSRPVSTNTVKAAIEKKHARTPGRRS
jgi:hypothetical protein